MWMARELKGLGVGFKQSNFSLLTECTRQLAKSVLPMVHSFLILTIHVVARFLITIEDRSTIVGHGGQVATIHKEFDTTEDGTFCLILGKEHFENP